MKSYIDPAHKASQIISYFKKKGFIIVDDPSSYSPSALRGLSKMIDDHYLIAIIKFGDSYEVSISENYSISDIVPDLGLIPKANDSITTVEELTMLRVVESLKRARIHNPPLLRDLEKQVVNIDKDSVQENASIDPKDIILMKEVK